MSGAGSSMPPIWNRASTVLVLGGREPSAQHRVTVAACFSSRLVSRIAWNAQPWILMDSGLAPSSK